MPQQSVYDESIYGLIPEPEVIPERPAMHRSKYGGSKQVPPSYSTFPSKKSQGFDTTGAKQFTGRGAPIGKEVGPDVNPSNFLKKKPRTLPQPEPFIRQAEPRKAPIPAPEDKPVMGLLSEKNFVVSNAVEAITKPAKKTRSDVAPTPADAHKSYGKVPPYLGRVKETLKSEQAMANAIRSHHEADMADQKAHFFRPLPEEEKKALAEKLQARWDEKHKQYLSLPFSKDTAMQVQRKERVEAELKSIEDALAKLKKKVLYVYNDSPEYAAWAKQNATHEAQLAALAEQ